MPSKTVYKFVEATNNASLARNGVPEAILAEVSAGPEQVFGIVRINFRMRGMQIRMDRFGPISALANGLQVLHLASDNTVLNDFLSGRTLKALDDFHVLTGVDNLRASGPGGLDTWSARWTLRKAGKPYLIKDTERFAIVIQDDLSAIPIFQAMAQGILEY